MTNAEKYKDILRHILSLDELIAVRDGKPEVCTGALDCIECELSIDTPNCETLSLEWLLEESEEECLTQRNTKMN